MSEDNKTPEETATEQRNAITADESDVNANVSQQGEENLAHENETATTDAVPVKEESADSKKDDDANKSDDKKTDDEDDNKKDDTDKNKDGDDDKPGDDSKAAPDKKKRSAKKRIDELTKQKRDAERRELAALRELDRLRKENGGGGKSDDENSNDTPNEKPKQENFDSYDEYVEALTDWKIDQKAQGNKPPKTDDNNTNNGDQAGIDDAALKGFQEQVSEAKEKYDDYDEKVFDESLSITPEMFQVISQSDHGAEIAYALANNPDTAHKIAKLGNNLVSIAREIGKVEAGLDLSGDIDDDDDTDVDLDDDLNNDNNNDNNKPTPATKKTSNAPEPIKKGGSSEPGKKNPEEETMEEYRARREAEDKAAGIY